MLRVVLTIVVSALCATAIFAAIKVHQYGWDNATYGGADPWSLFFSGVGAATVPLTAATAIAGLWKLFSKSSSFLDVWLVVFFLSAMFFAYTSYKVVEYEKTAIVAPASAPELPLRFLSAVGQCPISADFITEPEVTEAAVPLAGTEVQSTTVRSFVKGAVVSIECTNIAPDVLFPGLDDATILSNYARFFSITPIENENGGISEETVPVTHLKLEGTKDISGIEVTYSYRLFRFQANFALVVTGVTKGTTDFSDLERFLESLTVELVAAREELPELNQIIVSGSYSDLENALLKNVWSKKELGAALIATAGVNKPAEATLLLEHGADVDFAYLRNTSLIVATYENNVDAAIVLLEAGANPNYVLTFEWRPLHKTMRKGASNDAIIMLLLNYGAEIDARTSLKVTPLHRAAGFCLESAARIFLQHGANIELRDKYGQTAADRADKAGCPEIAEFLR